MNVNVCPREVLDAWEEAFHREFMERADPLLSLAKVQRFPTDNDPVQPVDKFRKRTFGARFGR